MVAESPLRQALELGEENVLGQVIDHEDIRINTFFYQSQTQGRRTPTPESVSKLDIRAFILQCEGTSVPIAPVIEELLEKGVPGLLWGLVPSRVRAVRDALVEDHPLTSQTIRVVCHNTLPLPTGSNYWAETCVAVVGTSSVVPKQVHFLQPCLCPSAC